MTKLIDLTHRKASTDLIVDCALLAVWYGFPEASRLLLQWLRHRTDDSASTMYIEALRHMRFEAYDEAELVLRRSLEQEPDDEYALALLVSVLDANGRHAESRQLGERLLGHAGDPVARKLVESVAAQRGAAQLVARPSRAAPSVVVG